MLIILEGPDGVGKSTRARELRDEILRRHPDHRVDIFHRGAPTEHPLDEYVTPLVGYRPGEKYHIICDRWHLGEFVYPRVFDRDSKMDNVILAYISMFLRSRGAFVIYMDAPNHVIRQRIKERVRKGGQRGEMPPLESVRREYNTALQMSSSPFVTKSYVGSSGDNVIHHIAHAEHAESAAASLSPFTTYIGPNYPDVLLVGDTNNGVEKGGYPAPAFMPYQNTSGYYLFRTIYISMIGLETIGIINSDDDVRAFISRWYGRRSIPQSDRLTVVTLGNRSYEAMRALDIPVDGAVGHPQYWRRFYPQYSSYYGRAIRDAVVESLDLRGEYPQRADIDLLISS